MIFKKDAYELLCDKAENAYPHECCGILLGDEQRIERLIPARNVHSKPGRHFEIDPQALIDAHRAAREGDVQIAGYYHSHPEGPASPSETDREQSARDGKIWAIAAEEGVRLWRDEEGGFRELSYQVSQG